MTLVETIEAFEELGTATGDHPLDCRCTECNLFMEMADSIANTPMKEIQAAARVRAKQQVANFKRKEARL